MLTQQSQTTQNTAIRTCSLCLFVFSLCSAVFVCVCVQSVFSCACLPLGSAVFMSLFSLYSAVLVCLCAELYVCVQPVFSCACFPLFNCVYVQPVLSCACWPIGSAMFYDLVTVCLAYLAGVMGKTVHLCSLCVHSLFSCVLRPVDDRPGLPGWCDGQDSTFVCVHTVFTLCSAVFYGLVTIGLAYWPV